METFQSRDQIPDQYKWKVEDIFESDETWQAELGVIKHLIEDLKHFKGKLSSSATALYECLHLFETVSLKVEQLYVYTHLKKDENTKNPNYQALEGKASTLYAEYLSATSYLSPEILEIETVTLKNFYEQKKELLFYKKFIEEIQRAKPHTLSEEQEEILAQLSEILSAPDTIFDMIDNADMKFPIIQTMDGTDIQITHGNYISLMENKDRQVRQSAFEALYDTYEKQIHTIAATLNTSIKKNVAETRIRHYSSTLEGFLFSDNVPVSVYTNVIQTVRNHLNSMYRYVRLRKQLLHVDMLHMYDVFVPLVEDFNVHYSYEDAYDTMLQGLASLGEEYIHTLQQARTNHWIDVYETEGKQSGAYQSGVYGTHPYVLLNFNGTLDSVFTLAHELGHAMHTYYSNQTQPYLYAGYTIFAAEVASTVNEVLLNQYLISNTSDPKMKKYLITHFLEQFRGTVFRQTMFAEFEKVTHERVESGETLTAETFSDIYKQLNETYYGPEMVSDERIRLEWARIPHFYHAFYVYKYATGFCAAVSIANRILTEGDTAVQDYLNFLKSGGTDFPIEELKLAGVDMNSPKPIEAALAYFGQLVDELESL